jgi:hypothetical protein
MQVKRALFRFGTIADSRENGFVVASRRFVAAPARNSFTGLRLWPTPGTYRCPLFGLDRKWLAEGETDANDPERTPGRFGYAAQKLRVLSV